MTVKELIAELSKYDSDWLVVDIECMNIEEVRADKIVNSDSTAKIDVVRLL